MRKSSDFTVTDQFCGAGGSSLGATAAGAQVVLAMNHWKLAVETHNTNFPDTLHDCTDISACDPRRYPRTDILITSPECTNHSSWLKGKSASSRRNSLCGKLPRSTRRQNALAQRCLMFRVFRNTINTNVLSWKTWSRPRMDSL